MSWQPQQGQPPQSAPQQQPAADLPEHARQRLMQMRGDATRRGLFTSDLSVNEFLLTREAGFAPLGLVMGSSIYHIGINIANWNKNQEMQVMSQAMYHARNLAMTRMQEEANVLSADGVIGVRLIVNRYQWGEAIAEFMAIGTAVRALSGQSFRNARGLPFTSDLSGQDFWTLLRAGYRPVSMVMGSCVYHVAHMGLRQAMKTVGQNIEMVNYTQALYDARELAMERMQAEAMSFGAQGVVGMRVQEGSHGWESHVIEYFAVGTAVIPISEEHQVPPPTMTISLNDPS
ncbi:MAG TPA: heavy metal-binding domain-containing protein [Ktedonobacteraceae bacterium]|nr:heavy metal-binding domain-containing protein [Ktedonobacteraceae bacterium]